MKKNKNIHFRFSLDRLDRKIRRSYKEKSVVFQETVSSLHTLLFYKSPITSKSFGRKPRCEN